MKTLKEDLQKENNRLKFELSELKLSLVKSRAISESQHMFIAQLKQDVTVARNGNMEHILKVIDNTRAIYLPGPEKSIEDDS